MDIVENSDDRLVWSALEYEEKERSSDWFWALGVIVVTSALASVIFGNYFFAFLLILSGLLLGFFAIKKPDVITYELNEKGFRVRNRLYLYENIKSFWVQGGNFGEIIIKPLFFIHTERAFMPIITIPIDETIAEDIHAVMLSQNIPEIEMKEHPSEKIMEALGF